MFGCGNEGKSNEQVIEEMEEQSEKTGRPVITELSEKVTVYDFSDQKQEETGSNLVEETSGGGRINDIGGRVDHYMNQGMGVTEAARVAYGDISEAYQDDLADINEVQEAVQELETYVEDKGGDLQAASEALDSKTKNTLERVEDASESIDNVYKDLIG